MSDLLHKIYSRPRLSLAWGIACNLWLIGTVLLMILLPWEMTG